MHASKPHFTFKHRVWLCATRNPYRVGYGYTVKAAWDDWQYDCIFFEQIKSALSK